MNIEKFVALRPFLYHLTDESNLVNIIGDRTLKSTATLADLVNLKDKREFLRTRRVGHTNITNGSLTFSIRDQDPLYENIINKNLKDGMDFGDFVYLLNSRVFFWAKRSDLAIHYGRYAKMNQFPIILKANTAEVFALNKSQPQFCKYNSGAPRCCSHYPEKAAPRGKNTFSIAEKYPDSASTVREVTFLDQCILPDYLEITYNISSPFKPLK